MSENTNENEIINTAALAERTVVPRGTYTVLCRDVEHKKSGKGNDMTEIEFEIISPAFVEAGGIRIDTAGKRFRSYFVWAQNRYFWGNLGGLIRGFALPQKNGTLAQIRAAYEAKLTEDGVGTTFKWTLASKPEYVKVELTEAERAEGVAPSDKLDAEGRPILKENRINPDWNNVIGDTARLQM